jgi:hypothetical protein
MGSGGWMMYSVMTDAIMLSMLMDRHGYVVENHSAHVSSPPRPWTQGEIIGIWIVGGVFALIVIVAIVAVAISSRY